MTQASVQQNTSLASLTPHIVYQHADWVILYKPTGYSVQDLSTVYQSFFPAFHPVHRLDKETSGLWLIALNAQANQYLCQCFQEKTIDKTYVAILDSANIKKKQGLITGDMEKSRRKAWRLLKTKHNPAQTRFLTASLSPGLRAAWLMPRTGKTHQLRVAMKSNSSAIVGDHIYANDSAKAFDRLYLHAYQLAFDYHGERFQVNASPNTGELFLSSNFMAALSQLILKAEQSA